MKPTRLLLAVPLFFCQLMVLIGAASAQDGKEGGEPNELNRLRNGFQLKLNELNQPLSVLNTNYRSYLEKQKTAYQQKGQLKEMLAVEEELTTFETEPVDELSTYPELKRLQEIYREQRKVREKAMVEPKRKLIAYYRNIAGEMAAAWTRDGKIEPAKGALVLAERFATMEKDAEAALQESRVSRLGMKSESEFEGKTAGEEMRNSLGMKLCWIPAGKFTMGSPPGEEGHNPNQETQVEVRMTRGYWIGKYEVTKGEYKKLTGINQSSFGRLSEDGPVDKVSWNEAVAFCKALSEREKSKLPEGWAYRLPTEAQWEYACRAGEKGRFCGDNIDEVGWYKANSEGSPQEVGKKKANAWGLHDVHGNVREWCQDWMTGELEGGRDPDGPSSGTARAVRGGCWNYPHGASRAAQRSGQLPTDKVYDLGFRVVLSPLSK
ncbi:MAG: formylglycine-generating enzyme family protein [Verrucomicrobiales bacterium]|nr:formylglycine-generating enzyme family protein [Verrucomicrobiales bacterium]